MKSYKKFEPHLNARTDDKIYAILDYADSRSSFDTDFIYSIKDYYETHGELSLAQEDALDNIITRFRIEVP